MANKVPLTCFNESKTAKLVISFERQRRDMIRRDFMEKHYLEYFILISKYLINQGMSHEEILILLRKYTALVLYYSFVYYYINKNDNKEYFESWNVPAFNALFKNDEIDMKALLSLDLNKKGENPFVLLYSSLDYNNIKSSQKSLFEKIDIAEGNKIKLKYLFKCFYDYFYYNISFKNNPMYVYGHNDLVLSLCYNDNKLNEFTFEPLDKGYKSYLVNKKPNAIEEAFNIPLLGYAINAIFENDNLMFDKEMSVRSDYYYNIMLSRARGKTIRGIFKFFNHIDDNKAIINNGIIDSSFDFMYNNEKYSFTKKGIIKIQ